MNVSLTPELEEFVRNQVESGRFRSASEAVREGIRMLEDRTREREAKLEALREMVGAGIDELDRGEAIDVDQVFDEILDGLSAEDDVSRDE
jgi:antitoxin ParD1/3/4